MQRNFYVVEYSKTQDCFHTHDVTSMLKNNIGAISSKHISDYLVIGMFETENEARMFADSVRDVLNNKKNNWIDDLLKTIL